MRRVFRSKCSAGNKRNAAGRGVPTHQAEADGTGEPQVLCRIADLGVAEEENHGDQGADNHGSPSTPKPPRCTHGTCQDWTKNSRDVYNGVVSPSSKVAVISKLGPASL